MSVETKYIAVIRKLTYPIYITFIAPIHAVLKLYSYLQQIVQKINILF